MTFAQLCTGCMHEIYKAAMFLIPGIRSFNEVTGLGAVLSTCPGTDLAWTGKHGSFSPRFMSC
jgi:hypothetical protein